MGIRIVTGAALIAAVLAWLFIADYAVFTMGALLMYMVGAHEMGPLSGLRWRHGFLLAAVLAACATFYFAVPGDFVLGKIPPFAHWLVYSSMLAWIPSLWLLARYPGGTGWHRSGILSLLYGLLMLLPFLIGVLIIRSDNMALDHRQGALALLSVMMLVWCCDSGAYFCGRLCGRRKLIPSVSPNKTVEGLLGGLALAAAAAALLCHLGMFGSYGESRVALMAAAVGAIAFSVEGDLVESMLKRMAGIKDSGRIFPGHGGMLDRIDSELSAIPAFLTIHALARALGA
ncbi:MAG: phosphatidate cytidylyltransferase [Succinivibrionaceae bacterium]|nr:phosphatidate cytidylyltransferase [Succinivibrionaceae bacterium]